MGWAICSISRPSETPVRTDKLPIPIDNLEMYKSLTRLPWDRDTFSTSGTGDVGSLATKLSKECSKKPLDADAYTFTPKRPRVFPPTDQEGVQERGEGYSSEEESSLTSQEEEQTQETLQLQLRKQLRQQRDIRQQLKFMLQQVLKTQAGLHVNPLLFNQL